MAEHATEVAPMKDLGRSHEELTIEELAHRQGVTPVRSPSELAAEGIFDSDEELEAFIAYTYECRRRDTA